MAAASGRRAWITSRPSTSHRSPCVKCVSPTSHILAILPNDRYMCDCCMGINLGIPCRHFFQAWTTFVGLPFHIGLIRQRCVSILLLQVQRLTVILHSWLQDPSLDISSIPAVTFNHQSRPLNFPVQQLPTAHISNPLERTRASNATPAPSTQTLGARVVHQEATSALRPILESVRTQEDLQEVLDDLEALRYVVVLRFVV